LLPLDGFAFHLEDSRPVRISFDPRLRDDPTGWQFALFRPTARHVMAVGVWRGLGSDFVIRPSAVDATELW
jgi:4'-phosphopantetheinyl transferase